MELKYMSKKIKGHNVKRKSEKELEKEAIMEEKFSILGIILVLIICTVIGIVIGYFLYRLAINSSNVAYILL
jgi:F0F1-type ATP synthase assembly protein I